MDLEPTFGDQIAQALARHDRPQSWLATRLHVSASAVSRWISGGSRPSVERVGQLADVLGIHGEARQKFLKAAGYGVQITVAPGKTEPPAPKDVQLPIGAEQPGTLHPQDGIRSAIRDYTRYLEEKTRDFVGRQFVFDAIDRFIRNSPRGYYFVRGDPGIGKTAVAGQLVKTHGYVHHFNIRGEGINRHDIFLKNVCAQLITAYGLPHDALPPDVSQDGGFFYRLLNDVSDRLPANERAVLVVDALDEVDTPPGASGINLLYLPMILPPNVYIVVTMRDVPLTLRIEVESDALTIEQDSDGNIADIRLYVVQALERPRIKSYLSTQRTDAVAFVEHLVEKSEGNFMYLRYVLPEIERGAYQDLQLAALPSGLRNYYEDHWSRMRGQDEQAWFEFKLPIIMALTEVKEPVSLDMIAHFSGVHSRARISNVLRDWRQFLYEQVGEREGRAQRRYRIYHSSFHDFVARKEEVEGERVDRQEANKKIADVLWDQFFGERDSSFR